MKQLDTLAQIHVAPTGDQSGNSDFENIQKALDKAAPKWWRFWLWRGRTFRINLDKVDYYVNRTLEVPQGAVVEINGVGDGHKANVRGVSETGEVGVARAAKEVE